MIRVGTSGFSYPDWKGPFYPPAMKPTEYLSYYADRFDACELNFTYYRMPDARTLARMVEKSHGRVEFTVKAFRAMTHTRDAPPESVAVFAGALASASSKTYVFFNNHFRAKAVDNATRIREMLDHEASM